MTSIFTRIVNRELPANIFLETDEVIVIADHRPKAPVHLLIIPKVEVRNFYEASPTVLNLMNDTVKLVAKKLQIEDHFRIIVNNGLGQEIDHIHYHFLSDRGADRVQYLKQ